MTWKPSVYVSSSYEDLKAERSIVWNAANAVGISAIGMEHYGAQDRPPLERCVADVQQADLYVGIIGWRYGSKAPGLQVSFTEAEFDAATAAKIPRLMYFIADDRRPADCSDDDPIMGFRERISRQPLVRYLIKSREDFATRVGVDLKGEVLLLSAQNDPEQFLLPYLCDREPQTTAVAGHLSEAGATSPICLLYGAVDQTPLKYLACLERVYLPELVGEKPGTVKKLNLAWPVGPVSEVSRTIRIALAREFRVDVRLEPAAVEQLVRQKLAEHPGPVLLSFQAPELDGLEESRLRALVAYFQAWPAQAPVKPDLILILSSYKPSKPGLLATLGLRRNDRAERAARIAAEKLKTLPALRLLPELSSVRQHEASEWIQRDELARLSIERNLEQEVAQIFSDRKELPMAELAPKLLDLLFRAPGRPGPD